MYEGLQTCFCFQLYGVLSLVRVSDFWLKANFYMLGIYSLPRGSIVPNCRVYCMEIMARNRPLVFQLICLKVKKKKKKKRVTWDLLTVIWPWGSPGGLYPVVGNT